MKYCSEEDTRDLRLSLEREILGWSDVTTKKMFGCPCYEAKGRLFVFLVTKGIAITQLQPADREKLATQYETSFFQAEKKNVTKWVKLPIRNNKELDSIMPFIRKSYEEALQKEQQ